MRIAFISGAESTGGAARAAIRLHDALDAVSGVRMRHFTGRVDRAESTAVCFTQPGRLRTVMNAAVRAAGWEEAGLFRRWQGSANRRNLLRRVREWEPDVIHLHNISPWTRVGFGREIVPELATIAPVVWRMPDMWPVSGCCSYTDFCERGGVDCSWAAQRETPPGTCGRHAAAEREALAALGDRLVLVSPSSWLAGVAREAFGARIRVEHILSGLDLDFWKPLDRTAARLALGLDSGGVLVLAIAERLSLRLKGAGELLAALGTLGSDAPRLLSAGRIPPTDLPRFPADALHLGTVNDDRVLRLAYAAADVVAVPSLAENLPGVAVESLACGRPVVAFLVGGVPDIVRPGETGWLAPQGDTGALADALREAAAMTTEHAALLSDRCRTFALRECDGNRQARRYLELFPEMMPGQDMKS